MKVRSMTKRITSIAIIVLSVASYPLYANKSETPQNEVKIAHIKLPPIISGSGGFGSMDMRPYVNTLFDGFVQGMMAACPNKYFALEEAYFHRDIDFPNIGQKMTKKEANREIRRAEKIIKTDKYYKKELLKINQYNPKGACSHG